LPDLRDTTRSGTWNGLPLKLSARLVSRYAWQTASIVLEIEDHVVLQTGGVYKAVGETMEAFEVRGERHEAKLRWSLGTPRSFPCQVFIDGAPVRSERVRVDNWWIGLWPWIPFALIVAWAANR